MEKVILILAVIFFLVACKKDNDELGQNLQLSIIGRVFF